MQRTASSPLGEHRVGLIAGTVEFPTHGRRNEGEADILQKQLPPSKLCLLNPPSPPRTSSDLCTQLEIQHKDWDVWTPCFLVYNVTIPGVPYVGFTAHTGDVSGSSHVAFFPFEICLTFLCFQTTTISSRYQLQVLSITR
jgi:hypothetical protein